jgi:3-hydroxyisobutyrate dehydrogenase-like beta-hydroxyacid dehydrogenase
VQTVGIVSTGAMGSAVGDALCRGEARVVATVVGRSARTAALAAKTAIELLPDLAAVVRESAVILSIVPPEFAEAAAAAIAELARTTERHPLVADLNAVSPASSRRLAEVVASGGCDYVDGSVSGPPPWRHGTTRISLSGERALDVRDLPLTGVERIVVGHDVGMASAVKMSTASVYKGTSALLAQALLAADANGVLEHVLDDLRAGSPDHVANIARRLATAAAKSGRYVAEMHEIAATQAAAGLTPSLFDAVADVFAALTRSDLARSAPEELSQAVTLDVVIGKLQRARATDGST